MLNMLCTLNRILDKQPISLKVKQFKSTITTTRALKIHQVGDIMYDKKLVNGKLTWYQGKEVAEAMSATFHISSCYGPHCINFQQDLIIKSDNYGRITENQTCVPKVSQKIRYLSHNPQCEDIENRTQFWKYNFNFALVQLFLIIFECHSCTLIAIRIRFIHSNPTEETKLAIEWSLGVLTSLWDWPWISSYLEWALWNYSYTRVWNTKKTN